MSNPKTAGWEEPGPGTVTAGDLVGLRRLEPTIRLSTCRQDGRCPECGQPVVQAMRLPCGCHWHLYCWQGPTRQQHQSDLLTEALRQRDEGMDLSLRCLYRANHPTKKGAITACCVLDAGHAEPHKFVEVVEEERDAAIQSKKRAREKIKELTETARVLGEERDAAIREAASRYDCHGGPGTTTEPCGACVSCVMRRAEKAERERDEARARTELLGQAVGLATTAVPDMEMNPDDPIGMMRQVVSRVQIERKKADRAEALLRECDRELTATAGAVADLLCDPAWVVLHNHGWATLKARRNGIEALVAKIREALHG
jgi:hypothetical protein